MIYTYEITLSDISVEEKYLGVIYEQEVPDCIRTVIDVAACDSKATLRRWADKIIKDKK
jgi:hypothetical protein